jgi:hypothetical protein
MTPAERLRAAAERLDRWAILIGDMQAEHLCLSDTDDVAEAVLMSARTWPHLAAYLRLALRDVGALKSIRNQEHAIRVTFPFAGALADAILGGGS